MMVILKPRIAGNNALKKSPVNLLIKSQLDGFAKVFINGQDLNASLIYW